jgi:DNA-binding XRE family transcriptional regulator
MELASFTWKTEGTTRLKLALDIVKVFCASVEDIFEITKE